MRGAALSGALAPRPGGWGGLLVPEGGPLLLRGPVLPLAAAALTLSTSRHCGQEQGGAGAGGAGLGGQDCGLGSEPATSG